MVDVLAIGAHPDDVELRAGGTLAAFVRRGHSVGILHLTRGELATRGDVDTRRGEAQGAARALGAEALDLLDLGDGRLADDGAARDAVIAVIRARAPRLLLVPWPEDEHPDHAAAGRLARSAWYLAGIPKVAPRGGAAHRPGAILFYPGHEVPAPALVLALTGADFDKKRAAIACYRSQFHDPASSAPETRISTPLFLDGALARSRYFGSLVGAEHGEPFLVSGPRAVRDPAHLLP